MRNVFTRTGAGPEDGQPDADDAVNRPPATPAAEPGAERPGRGRLSVVLAGVGAFLLVAGLLLRFYAAPQLIAAPTSVEEIDLAIENEIHRVSGSTPSS